MNGNFLTRFFLIFFILFTSTAVRSRPKTVQKVTTAKRWRVRRYAEETKESLGLSRKKAAGVGPAYPVVFGCQIHKRWGPWSTDQHLRKVMVYIYMSTWVVFPTLINSPRPTFLHQGIRLPKNILVGNLQKDLIFQWGSFFNLKNKKGNFHKSTFLCSGVKIDWINKWQ